MKINSFSVSIPTRILLNAIDLEFAPGTVHALMGPNGSGKSSLALALMGHHDYQIVSGTVLLYGTNILELSPHKRAQAGLFLAFQQPRVIPGVKVIDFLHEAYRAVVNSKSAIGDFYEQLIDAMDLLGIDYAFAQRHVNDGFSGGQKKKLELLQLVVLQPKVAILDEIDSGLDVDALKLVANALAAVRKKHPAMIIVIITHYQRLLQYIVPDTVHVMKEGHIVCSGDASLVSLIDTKGYDAIT